MTIAVTSVSGIIERTRKDVFVATANAYIEAVKQRVFMGDIILPVEVDESVEVYLDKTMAEKGGIVSPYGNNYTLVQDSSVPREVINVLNQNMNTAVSNITITCEQINDNACEYVYYLFLSDGKMAIGCYGSDTNSGWGYYPPDIKTSIVQRLDYCE